MSIDTTQKFRTQTPYTNIALVCNGLTTTRTLYTDLPMLGKKLGYFDAVFQTYRADTTTPSHRKIKADPMPEITDTGDGILSINIPESHETVMHLLSFLEFHILPASMEQIVRLYMLAKKWKLNEYQAHIIFNRINLYDNWLIIAKYIIAGNLTELKEKLIDRVIVQSPTGCGAELARIENIENFVDCCDFAKMATNELVVFIDMRFKANHNIKFNLPVIFRHFVPKTLAEALRVLDTINGVLDDYKRNGHGESNPTIKTLLMESFESKCKEIVKCDTL